jgi:hypothetical protein
VVSAIFDDLRNAGMTRVDEVMNGLPKEFPEHVRGPIYSGKQKRMRVIEMGC